MRKTQPQLPQSEEFTRFEQTLRNLMAVPKSEIDKEKVKYERQREQKGKRKEKGQPSD